MLCVERKESRKKHPKLKINDVKNAFVRNGKSNKILSEIISEMFYAKKVDNGNYGQLSRRCEMFIGF